MGSVRNVVTRDTQRDISKWINAVADQHGFDAVGFLGGLIAESNLDEQSYRERTWPDVSYGLSHPAVKWLGPEVAGLTRNADGTVKDTKNNRRVARDYMWDAARSIQYTAPRYAALVQRWGDPLEAWCRWNKPNMAGVDNPARSNYIRGLEKAQEYMMGAVVGQGIQDAMDASGDEAITNEWTEDKGGAKVAYAWGNKGLYIASDDSGSWVVAGPFGGAEA